MNEFVPQGESCDPAAPACAPGLVCRLLDGGATTETCEFPQCSDGLDNDGDGITDFPDEPGCDGVDDNDEQDTCPDGASCPECSNGQDDDNDTLTDYPNDPGCEFASDDSEIDECIPGVEVFQLDFGTTTGTTSGGSNFDPSCSSGNSSPEDIHSMVLDRDLLSLTVSTEGSSMDTITSVRLDSCDTAGAEIACADPGGGGESITITDPAQGTYHVFVDGHFDEGDYTLDVSGVIPGGDACNPGNAALTCESGFYCDSSSNTCEVAACDDGSDNDGDGAVDYPNDPGCASPSDNDEIDDCPSGASCPECANQTDDDADGLTDYPDDPGCIAAGDDNELDCEGESDGVQEITQPDITGTTVGLTDDFDSACDLNDGEDAVYSLNVPGQLTNLTVDASGSELNEILYIKADDCTSADLVCEDPAGDATAELSDVAPGLYFIFVDTDTSPDTYQLDVRGTIAAGEPCDPDQITSGLFQCESGFTCDGSSCVTAACNDGMDNDGDGLIDYPNEPGCESPSDDDETDPSPLPECSDGIDNDGDGETDFAEDTDGCEAASDNLELDPCTPGTPIAELTDAGVTGTTPESGGNFEGSCNSSTSSTEDVYAYNNTRNLRSLTFSTAGSAGDTVTYARFGMCDQASSEVACANVQDGGEDITIQDPAQDFYYVFVDGDFTSGIDYVLDVFGELEQGETCDPNGTQFICATGLECTSNTCSPTACNNGLDDDGDGVADEFDPGCIDLDDTSEEPDPSPLPECADGIDNDGDGLIDFDGDGDGMIDDTGCDRAADDLELNCQDSDPVVEVDMTPITGDTTGATDDFVPSCSTSSTAGEIAHHITFPGALDTLTVDTCGSSYDTVLSIKGGTCGSMDLGCDDDDCSLQSSVTLTDVAAGEYFFLVDGYLSNTGSYELNVDAVIKSGEACDMNQVSAGIATCASGTSCTNGTCQ